MPTLYGAPVSPFVRKVMVALAEKGIVYEHDPVLPAIAPTEFKRVGRDVSPLGRIPAYRDDDFSVADSSAIIAYLDRVKPSPTLYPSDTHDYARALWFEEYGDSGLAPIIGTKIFFQKIAGPAFFKQPTDEAIVSKAINEELPPLLDYLESQLGKGDWLVGRSFSIGDIGVATQFAQASFCGLSPDAKRWPKLAAYIERVLARPSFAEAIAKGRAMLGLK
ncbi:MAG TPA: glutathione S-transferase family protein [Candidatus Binataceae bacterium]|jgi:glutathione S-transferase|nr:glutathione S-transferase family protein [Candidatus Binataceae bacterium]